MGQPEHKRGTQPVVMPTTTLQAPKVATQTTSDVCIKTMRFAARETSALISKEGDSRPSVNNYERPYQNPSVIADEIKIKLCTQ